LLIFLQRTADALAGILRAKGKRCAGWKPALTKARDEGLGSPPNFP